MDFFTNIQRVGNRFWLRMYRDGKDCFQWIDDFKPTLYLKTQEKTQYRTIFKDYLKPVKTDSVKHAREMISKYDGVSGFELFGNPNWEYSYLFERFGNRLKYDPSLIHTAFIDIETKVGENSKGFPYPNEAREEITLITHFFKGKYHVFAVGDFDLTEHNDLNLDVYKHVYSNEDDMLKAYVKFWVSDFPHAVTDWNGESFDIPYIINRVRIRLGDDFATKLSPVGKIRLEFYEDDPTKVKRVEIKGVEHLDYLLLYKKYLPGERDFSLEAMSEDFLNEHKVENPTGGSFRDFYTGIFEFTGEPKNEIQKLAKIRTSIQDRSSKEYLELDAKIRSMCWNMFVWYNIRDVDLLRRLDKKLGMLNLTFTISYLVGMNYSDVFGTVKPWDIFLQNECFHKGLFFSVKDRRGIMPRPLMGGFVHLYKAGLYRDGVTLDATSLYPSIMMEWNISPETFVQEYDVPEDLLPWHDKNHIEDFLKNGIPEKLTALLNKHQMCMTINGMFYRTDSKGFIPEVVEDVFSQRKVEKTTMLDYEKQLEEVENEIKKLEAMLEKE